MTTLGPLGRLRLSLGFYTLVFPTLLLLLTFVYLPVAWAFTKSVYEFEVGAPSRFVGLSNYKEFLFHDTVTWPAFGNMLFLTFFHVCIRLTVPLVVAKLIHSLPSERARYAYRLLFLAPIVVPGVATQLMWGGLIFADVGLINEFLKKIGLEGWQHGWLSDPSTALPAVAFVGFPWIGGIDVLIYYAGLASIPDSVNEAAELEGCVGVRKFFLIDVPMVLSQLKLILILTIIGGVQGFEMILVLTRGGPGFKTTVPGYWMYLNAFTFQRMGYACAIGVVLFLVIFGLTALNLKYFKSAEDIQEVR